MDTITFTATDAVASGQVVAMGHTLGIATGAIAAGQSGEVAIEGVWQAPKVAAATFPQGSKLLWDASAGAFDAPEATPASGDILGGAIAAEAGIDGQTTVAVKLRPGNTGDLA